MGRRRMGVSFSERRMNMRSILESCQTCYPVKKFFLFIHFVGAEVSLKGN